MKKAMNFWRGKDQGNKDTAPQKDDKKEEKKEDKKNKVTAPEVVCISFCLFFLLTHYTFPHLSLYLSKLKCGFCRLVKQTILIFMFVIVTFAAEMFHKLMFFTTYITQ